MTQYLYGRISCFLGKSVLIALAATLPLMNSGCTLQATTKTSQAVIGSPNSSKQETETLQVAVIPWQSPEVQQKKLQPLAEYLEKQTGRKFDFHITKDYKTSVDLLVDGKVDIAFLAAATYIQAKQRNPQVEPIVVPIDKTTGRPWYSGVIVVNTDRGIQSLQDLKGKRFAFVSPSSTSGYILPSLGLKDQGINPERDFASIKYSGSHDKAETDLANGVVDAIADDKPSFLRSHKTGKLSAAKYKIIWESTPIPTGPIVVSTKLSPELITNLKKALINAPDGAVDVSGTESAGYTLAKDSDYDSIRKLKSRLETLVGAGK